MFVIPGRLALAIADHDKLVKNANKPSLRHIVANSKTDIPLDLIEVCPKTRNSLRDHRRDYMHIISFDFNEQWFTVMRFEDSTAARYIILTPELREDLAKSRLLPEVRHDYRRLVPRSQACS